MTAKAQSGENPAKKTAQPKPGAKIHKRKPTLSPEQKEAAKLQRRAERVATQGKMEIQIKKELKTELTKAKHKDNSLKGRRYTPELKAELFDKIINSIESGESVFKTLAKYRVGSTTFYDWVDNDKSLFARYARAHDKRADALFDRLIEVAIHMPDVNRARLVVDTTKYVCGKLNPNKYSEKQNINIINTNTTNNIGLSTDERDEKIKAILNKANGLTIDIPHTDID